jgi:hypothetical protein
MCLGYAGRCVDDCVLIMQALWTDKMYIADPFTPPLPFRNDIYTADTPLRVGYFVTDGFYEPAPACKRAVMDAVAALSRLPNVTLVPFQPAKLAECVTLFYALMTPDSGDTIFGALEVVLAIHVM